MRILRALPLVFALACASGGNAPMGSGDKTIALADGTGGFLRIRGGDGAKVATIPFPIDKVWRVLPGVYDSLGIKITDLDPATHILGNGAFKVHRALGTVSLSRFLDCGNAQAYPSAETYDIQMSVKTQIEESKDGGTTIGTLVEAAGRPMAFAGEYVRCSSKGELENRIADGVKAQLSR